MRAPELVGDVLFGVLGFVRVEWLVGMFGGTVVSDVGISWSWVLEVVLVCGELVTGDGMESWIGGMYSWVRVGNGTWGGGS